MTAIVLVAAAHDAYSQDPAKFFEDNCAMCHAIGGPPGGAPDLKGITARRDRTWLVQFILNPEDMAKRDVAAAALVKEYDGMIMPSTDGVTPELVETLLRFIDRGAAAAAGPGRAQADHAFAPAAERVATDAERARAGDWYRGRAPFAHRGPACVSCHTHASVTGFGGGTLAPDLTHVDERLGGARGVATWLRNPPTRVMRAVFRSRPLEQDETLAIAAMLSDHSTQQAPRSPRGTGRFVAASVGVATAALCAMAVVWRRRMTGVRQAMVAAAQRRLGGEP